MTIEEFQKQVLEINAQWTNIKAQAMNIATSGNETLKESYLENVQNNIQLLHASLYTAIDQLTEQQIKNSSWLIAHARAIAREMLRSCSEDYQKAYEEEKKGKKSSRTNSKYNFNVGCGGGESIY